MGQAAKASELLGRLRAASRGSVAGAPPRPMPTLTLPAPVQHYTAPPSGAPAAPAAPVVGAGAPVRRHARAAHAREHAALRAPCGALRAPHQRAAQRGGVGPRRAGRRAERPPAGGAKRGAQRREVHAAPRGRRLPRGLRHRPRAGRPRHRHPSTKAYELTVALHLPSHAHSPKGRAEARARRLETKDKHDYEGARVTSIGVCKRHSRRAPSPRAAPAAPRPPPPRGAMAMLKLDMAALKERLAAGGESSLDGGGKGARAQPRVARGGPAASRSARERPSRARSRRTTFEALAKHLGVPRTVREAVGGAQARALADAKKAERSRRWWRARAPAPTGDPPYIVHWQSSVQSTSVERACPCVASFSAR